MLKETGNVLICIIKKLRWKRISFYGKNLSFLFVVLIVIPRHVRSMMKLQVLLLVYITCFAYRMSFIAIKESNRGTPPGG